MKKAKLIVTKGEAAGISFYLKTGEEASIGRNLECSIPVPDIKLSRIHCVVRHHGENYEVLDNKSTNGTLLNGKKIVVAAKLKDQDIIQIGDTEIKFYYED